jgi:spermidine/putrescine transport system permease protein
LVRPLVTDEADHRTDRQIEFTEESRVPFLSRLLKLGYGLVVALVVAVYAFLYVPILMIFWTSFHPDRIITYPLPSYSLRWYKRFLENTELHAAIINSLIVGASAALISGVLGTLAALALVRFNFKGRALLQNLVYIPIVFPKVIIGVALLTLLFSIDLPRGFLYLIIGHVVLTLPFVILVVAASLYGFPRELEDAALDLGANDIQTFRHITLPLIMPSVIAGMLFAFTVSFQDFEASQAWASPESRTLPIAIFGKIRDELSPEINVVGVVFVLVAVFVPLLAERIMKIGRG